MYKSPKEIQNLEWKIGLKKSTTKFTFDLFKHSIKIALKIGYYQFVLKIKRTKCLSIKYIGTYFGCKRVEKGYQFALVVVMVFEPTLIANSIEASDHFFFSMRVDVGNSRSC